MHLSQFHATSIKIHDNNIPEQQKQRNEHERAAIQPRHSIWQQPGKPQQEQDSNRSLPPFAGDFTNCFKLNKQKVFKNDLPLNPNSKHLCSLS